MSQETNQSSVIPARQEVPQELRWKLADLFASGQEWEKQYQATLQQVPQLEQWRGRLGQAASELLAALHLRDEVSQQMERLYVYARLWRDEDNANEAAQTLLNRAQNLSVKVESALSYLVPEIIGLPDATLQEFLQAEPRLAPYAHLLADLQRQARHILSPAEEALLAEMGEVADAPQHIFGLLTNADLEFPEITDQAGNQVPVSQGRFLSLMENPNREVRQRAFRAFYATFAGVRQTLAATYTSSLKKDAFYARVRHYPSARHAALDADNVPLKVYDRLLQSVEDKLELQHRYLTLRRQVLGVDRLHVYDLYVPLVPAAQRRIPYPEAGEIILEALRPLGPEYLEVVKQALASRWVDVMENQGKTSGAFAWGAYGTHPYILLNYQEDTNSLFTLAHELGHAVHSYFSDKHQDYVNAHYRILVAEVASTLNEFLLLQHLLQTSREEDFRRYLLNHYLEEFRGTVFRQTMFAALEKEVHQRAQEGNIPSLDQLNKLYLGLLGRYYGPEVELDAGIELEWARIPHFYNSFYVYKYATGLAASTALGRQILAEGEPAVQRYLAFLSAGGSDYPISLLQIAGVDLTTPEPVNQALAEFQRVLEEFAGFH